VFFERFTVAESSMSPSFREGDYVVTVRRRPRRGAAIVFEHPERPGFLLLKRVVATGGQLVRIDRGSILVDGREVEDPWTDDATTPDGEWVVPDGHVFVLGDARHRSVDDSRTLGPIRVGRRAAIVVLRYWPPRRLGRPRL
jgi:signal peptidase I